MATPLAWKNLTHDRKRLALAVCGIGFAVLLMFMQLGFRGAMFDSTLALPRQFDADLVLVNPQRYTMSVRQKFPRRYLQLAASSSLVAATAPLYYCLGVFALLSGLVQQVNVSVLVQETMRKLCRLLP